MTKCLAAISAMAWLVFFVALKFSGSPMSEDMAGFIAALLLFCGVCSSALSGCVLIDWWFE